MGDPKVGRGGPELEPLGAPCPGYSARMRIWTPLLLAGCISTATTPADTGEAKPDPSELEPLPPASDPLWDPASPPTFRMSFDSADWEDQLWALIDPEDDCAERTYLPAQATFVSPVDGDIIPLGQVGVRHRGHSGLDVDSNGRLGFKIKVNEYQQGAELFELERLNLLGTEGDHSQMREYLALRMARQLGLPAPRSNYAFLYVNDAYMGLYPFTEEPDDDAFLRNHLGGSGSLYQVSGYCGRDGDFTYESDEPEDYWDTYEPEADTDPEAMRDDLIPLITCANGSDFDGCIDDWIDADSFMQLTALDMVLPDVDGMAPAGQNFMLHYGAQGFVPYPWDKDQAFTVYNATSDSIFAVHPTWDADFWSHVSNNLMDHRRAEYCETVLQVAVYYDPDGDLGAAHADRMDFMAPYMAIEPHLDADRWGWISDDLIEVVRERHPKVVAEAQACAG